MTQKLDINIKESPFYTFQNSRSHISFKINAQNTYEYCKKNNLSYFIVSLGCLLKALNDVPELKRRIINNQAIEFDQIDGITPILDKDGNMLEMKVTNIRKNETLQQWHDKVKKEQKKILNHEKPSYLIPMNERDSEPIANFSCVPWVDFDSLTTCIESQHQTQPLVTWGKLTNGKMSVAISTSHIFVYGAHIGLFNKKLEEYFNNPELI